MDPFEGRSAVGLEIGSLIDIIRFLLVQVSPELSNKQCISYTRILVGTGLFEA